jgi:hypothetical protein
MGVILAWRCREWPPSSDMLHGGVLRYSDPTAYALPRGAEKCFCVSFRRPGGSIQMLNVQNPEGQNHETERQTKRSSRGSNQR